jgi:hypothetical protein
MFLMEYIVFLEVHMRFYMFEGTPEELSEVLPKIDVRLGKSEVLIPGEKAKSDKRWVTTEEARVILTRRPLSVPIVKMLQSLYSAAGKQVTSDELKKVTGLDAHEFRGMLGAFGRRVGHTAPANAQFFDQKWNHEAAQYVWSLPENVRQVVRELKIGP